MDADLLARRVPALEPGRTEALLQEAPEHRGFWTDDELIAASGISSVPLLRKIQSARWLIADQVPLARGGRMRAWTFREVLLAALLVEFSRCTGIAIQPAAHLLYRAGPIWVEEAAGLDQRIEAVQQGGDAPPVAERRLVIVDMVEAWAEEDEGRFRCLSRGMVLGSGPMTIPPPPARREASETDLDAGSAARLSVVLSRLRLRPLDLLRERPRRANTDRG